MSIPPFLVVEISFSPSDCNSILPIVVEIKITSFKVYLVGQSVFYDFDINWTGYDFVSSRRCIEGNLLLAPHEVSNSDVHRRSFSLIMYIFRL